MADEVAAGAVSGAASGTAVMPGWGTLIGAAVGAIGGFAQQRAKNKKIKRMQAEQQRLRRIASPQHLNEVMTTLQPLIRNIVASGLGPQFKASVEQSLASHGLTGTGVGEAMRTGAAGAPELFAAGMTEQGAESQIQTELGAEGKAADLEAETPGSMNPLVSALLAGARGYIGAGGSFGRTGAARTATNAPAPSAGGATSVMPGGKPDPYSITSGMVPPR